MYVRPQSFANINDSFVSASTKETNNKISDPSVHYNAKEIDVALLDGLPLENHEAISDRIIVHDPDGFSSDYRPNQQVHGTSMASIIINGDASYEEDPLDRPIITRPVLKPKEVNFNQHIEQFPDDILFIDLIHRAVISFFIGESGLGPVAPNLKVINFSLGDIKRCFDTKISPLAMLIDWLSYKYSVLFIISCGNYSEDLDLEIHPDDFNNQSLLNQSKSFVRAVEKNSINKRLLSPAESINSITVGSYNKDGCTDGSYSMLSRINPVDNQFPSAYNSNALGHRLAIKPEILMPGGVMLYRTATHIFDKDALKLQAENMGIKSPNLKPGVKSAYPGNTGSTNSYSYSFGSSNATALVTRKAALICELVRELNSKNHTLDENCIPNIIKALLVHGADTRNINKNLYVSTIKRDIARFTGHGIVNEARMFGCQPNEATLIGTGKIKMGEQLLHMIPLPELFRNNTAEKRLIVTLSWFSPTNPNSQKYRDIKLKLDSGSKITDLMNMSREQDSRQVAHGTTYHEVYTTKKASLLFEQAPEIPIQISAQSDALNMEKDYEVDYTLIVTLDAPESDFIIYNEVSERLDIQIKQKV